MHSKIKQCFVGALTVALCVSFVGCFGGGTNSKVEAPDELSHASGSEGIGDGYLTAQQWLDTLETRNYEGYRFTVATTLQYSFVPEEESGLISTAVYERNRMVEEKYNITIVEKIYDKEQLLTEQKKAALSGKAIGDVITAPGEQLAVLADNNLLINLYSLPYFDPLSDYMQLDLVKASTVAHTMYAMYGSVTDVSNHLWAVFYNKEMLEDLDLTDPYERVTQGDWTWDAFLDMANTAAGETVDDNSPDPESDIYGFASYFSDEEDDDGLFHAVWQSSGEKYLGDTYWVDKLTIAVSPDITETLKATLKAVTYRNGARFNGTGAQALEAFTDGRLLFYVYEMSIAAAMGESGISWGIVPMPKLTAQQEDYHCWVDPQTLALGVAASVPDTERTGIILNALCAASFGTVSQAIEETYLNYYLTNNSAAVMLFDYVFAKAQLDPVHIYGVGMQELGKETYDIVKSNLTSSSKLSSKLLSSINLDLIEEYLNENFKLYPFDYI